MFRLKDAFLGWISFTIASVFAPSVESPTYRSSFYFFRAAMIVATAAYVA